jgi:uncharacterized membrane protein YhhN
MEPGHALVGAALGVGVGDWVAVGRGSRRAEYFLKPLTVALLIAAAVALRGEEPGGRWVLTLAALALSLAGDVFLMLPRNLFVAGLGSFLLAHLAYVAAFNLSSPPPIPTLLAAAGVSLAAGGLFLRLRTGLLAKGMGGLVPPVAAYVAAIGAMVVSALTTVARPDWDAAHAALAVVGAVLFMVSDSLIAWTRFIRPFRHARVAVMATYHLGQAGLVIALVG